MLEMSHKQIFGFRVILFNYKIKIDNSNESNLIQNTCSFYSLLTMNSHGAVLLGFVYVLNMAVIKLKIKEMSKCHLGAEVRKGSCPLGNHGL